MKGKHLTRSHAMRESTSPPRTPTPRGDQHGSAGPAAANGQTNYQQQQQQQQQHVVVAAVVVDANEHNNSNNNNNNNNNKLHVQSTNVNSNGNGNNTNNSNNGNTNNNGNNNRGSSPLIEAPIVIVTSQHKQQQQQHQNVAPLSNEAEFPKLTPPKKTSIAGQPQQNSNNSNNSGSSSNNKIEYNNNNSSSGNNNNSNGKKYDIKPNGNIVLETHKHGGGSGGGGGGNNNKHHQQQHHYVTDRSPSSTPPTTIYNSGMNYQLNTDRQERHDQQQQQHHHQQRNESQNSNDTDIAEQQQQHQQQQHHYERGGGGGGGGKKHRANTNSKSTKPRLKNLGGSSSGSNDGSGGGCGNTVPNLGNGSGTSSSMLSSSGGGGGNSSNNSSNNTSGFISRENSGEQYTDHGGTDLLSFFKETLNRNPKDRNLLMKIEKDLTDFVQEKTRGDLRFPAASSYNRMLIHRTAAYFGMEHNVDSETQQCVIVAVTKNTRIPEMRFKSLVRDQREDARKSILKRDTHSFDEPRQSPYLNPDRGMLDRKSKSFEEREENYERARSRIFSRGHADNSVGDGCIGEESYGSWSNSAEQQQRQARATGKFLKMQNSVESRDGRSSGGGGAVPKAHSFGGYGGPPSVGGPSLPRGDSTTSNKSSAGRSGFTKQDSTGSTNTAWRLSPTSSGSIYHFDPSNLPPNQALASGVYQQQQQQQASTPQQTQQQSQSVSNNNNSTSNYVPYRKSGGGGIPPTNQAHQQQQQQQQQLYANEAGVMSSSSTESYSDEVSNAQEGNTNAAYEYVSPAQAGAGDGINYVQTEQVTNETTLSQCPSLAGDECDNAATACLSITTTSTKNYDRIEVQKFKHQATSPNIPCDKEELPDSVQDVNHIAANNEGATTEHAQSSTPVAQVPPQQQQNCEASLSPSSTPYSSSEVSTKQVPEEPKTQTWTYTQTYQAADGSTMFHTAAAPNGAPYCTTYQQAPDGSIYAVPQGMIYAYPQPAESEVQGYLMPVFDPNQQRNDAAAAAAGMIPAGAQAIYQAPGGTATVMPVATAAYPAAQFATAANGAPIYQAAPVIYSSEQFAQAATGPGGGQLQQIPTMTTYPIGYPYPYNGYWGQTMTYYVPAQQAVAAAPLVSAAQAAAPPQAAQSIQQQPTHQPAHSTATLIPTGFAAGTQPPQVAGGMQLTSITPTAAGPQSGAGSNNNGNNGYHNNAGGTTYYGSGRVKRTPGGGSIHYNGATFHPTAGGAINPHQHHHAAAGHLPQHHATAQLITATIPGTGVGGGATTTTYHAVPTITLAAGPAHNAAGAPNTDLSAAPNGSAPMYALQAPHGAALLPTNVFPYAAAAAPGQALPPPPLPASNTTATVAAVVATAQSQQQNAVITAAPFYPASANTAGLMEAPATNANPYVSHGGTIVSNSVSQSAPSTPHSLNTQPGGGLANTRQPPIFSTPPIVNAASGGGGGIGGNGNGSGGYHSNSSTPHYYTSSNHNSNEPPQSTYISNSFDKRNNNGGPGRKPHNTYNISRQNSTSSGYNGATGGIKTPLLNSNNEPTPRASPSGINNGAGGYHPQHRTHPLNKRNGDKPQQAPLIGGLPPQPNAVYANSSYHANTSSPHQPNEGKPPVRLNAGAATFRHKPTSNFDFRRSVSQRNSPGTNGSSSNESNNNSPNSIVTGGANSTNSAATTPITTTAPATGQQHQQHVTLTGHGQHNGGGVANTPYAVVEPQPASHQATTGAPSLFITSRGTHIPPQLQHHGAGAPGQQQAAAVLGGAAMTALGAYNAGAASGVYFKYGQTYFAHPSVPLPNSRRSPSTADLRPQMAQMTGMYPATMMIQAPPRHAPGRHPNPNYKGTRPR